MTHVISCTYESMELNVMMEIRIYSPYIEDYVDVIARAIRLTDKAEYIKFCKDNELPIRNMIPHCNYYYELEIYD